MIITSFLPQKLFPRHTLWSHGVLFCQDHTDRVPPQRAKRLEEIVEAVWHNQEEAEQPAAWSVLGVSLFSRPAQPDTPSPKRTCFRVSVSSCEAPCSRAAEEGLGGIR
jgi:hypothetical protein